jgi:hypothetical protein
MVTQRRQAGGTHRDLGGRKRGPQQVFRRGAAADVADAHNQYLFEQGNLPRTAHLFFGKRDDLI